MPDSKADTMPDGSPDPMPDVRAIADALWLADWRRRVTDLYAHVRAIAATDPEGAWTAWRIERERLFRGHPQSPLPPAERASFRARHWPYDGRLRFDAARVLDDRGIPVASAVTPTSEAPGSSSIVGAGGPEAPAGSSIVGAGGSAIVALPNSGQDALAFRRVGRVELPLPDGAAMLVLYRMLDYAGGLFLPFRDATSGVTTYGAGRYLLDTAKGADLGGDPAAGMLVVDLNFAYHPSCAFDPRWACPLAPPENRLPGPVEAGERLA
jgi:hypothetical protein